MSKISVVINTFNEEKNISKAIKSVKDIADEIVVVDMESDDKTASIAKKAGAKVFNHKRMGYVEPARNFAIQKVTNEWILILDADETIPPTLINKLRRIVKKPSADYYRLPRKNLIFGKWIKNSRWWPDHNIRFFKKGAVSWSEVIHSVPETQGKGIDLAAKEELAITHFHYDSLEQYIHRMNRYTSAHAKIKIEEGCEFKWPDIIKKPMAEFLSRYFFGKGYKDGLHGLALSGLQAFSELVMYLKIWQAKEGFKAQSIPVKSVVHELYKAQKELNYWKADVLVKEGAGVIQKIKRKFKLH